MSFIRVAPTGKLVQGDVLDVNKRELERALHEYDRNVYLKWNPSKMNGWGCWELRRRPNEKTAIPVAHYNGADFFELDYLELDIVNCLKNWAFLNYSILGWMQENDQWGKGNFAENADRKAADFKAKKKAEADAELSYGLKQIKNQNAGLKELALSGKNLAELARYWK